MGYFGIWIRGDYDSAVGLEDLEGLFQHGCFCDSVMLENVHKDIFSKLFIFKLNK